MGNLGRQIEMNWPYSLTETSQAKNVPLSAVRAPYAGELAGIDGLVQGGVRPLSGFRQIHDFDGFQSDSNHDASSELVDFYPVNFKIEHETYAYGFVYRAIRPGSPTVADIFLDYYIEECGTWQKGESIRSSVSTTEAMSVVTTGRMVFVGIRGQATTLFYIDKKDPEQGEISSDSLDETSEGPDCAKDFQLIIETTPGPGKQPHLDSQPLLLREDHVGNTGSPTGTHTDFAEIVETEYWFRGQSSMDGIRNWQGGVPNVPGKASILLHESMPPEIWFQFGSTNNFLPSNTFAGYSVYSKSDDEVIAEILKVRPDFDCLDIGEDSSYYRLSNDQTISMHNTTDVVTFDNEASSRTTVDLSDAIQFIGSTPGFKRHPGGDNVNNVSWIVDPDTVPVDQVIDQTCTIHGYFYVDRSLVDDDKIVFDLGMKKGPFSHGTTFTPIVKGANRVLKGGHYESYIESNTSADGGTYYTLREAPFAEASTRVHTTNFNSVNNGTVLLKSTDGTTITYTVKNDGSAVAANNEFNAGSTPQEFAENFKTIVEDRHEGKFKVKVNPGQSAAAAVAASAVIKFGNTEYDDVNNATIKLTDAAGTGITYTAKNDYSAVAANQEFNLGASATVAAANLAILINSSDGHNGTITASAVAGTLTLTQATAGLAGNRMIETGGNFTSLVDVTTASLTFTFDPTTWNSVNGAWIKIRSTDNTEIQYTIKTDYTAVATDHEFEAGAANTVAAANFVSLVNGANGHNGKITAVDNGSGQVTLTQLLGGSSGNKGISDYFWSKIVVGNVARKFTGGGASETSESSTETSDSTTSGSETSSVSNPLDSSITSSESGSETTSSSGSETSHPSGSSSSGSETSDDSNFWSSHSETSSSGGSETTSDSGTYNTSETSSVSELSSDSDATGYTPPSTFPVVFTGGKSSVAVSEPTITITQGVGGPDGQTQITTAANFDNCLLSTDLLPMAFTGGGGAYAEFEFDSSAFNSVNGGTVKVTSKDGTGITYKIKNDYTANPELKEFEASTTSANTAANFKQIVESSNGHGTAKMRVYVDGSKVHVVNAVAGDEGEVPFVYASSFGSTTTAPAAPPTPEKGAKYNLDVVVEDLGPVNDAGSTHYYRVVANITDSFSNDNWGAGTYTYEWTVRAICGNIVERNDYAYRTVQFNVNPLLIDLQEMESMTTEWSVDNPVDIGSSGAGVPGTSNGENILANAQKFGPYTYGVAYMLYDSTTGRQSSLSDICRFTIPDTFIETSEAPREVPTHYISIDVTYDPREFDRMYVYRTLAQETTGGTQVASILSLEAIVNLKDHQLFTDDNDDSGVGHGNDVRDQSFYTFALTDEALLYKPTFDGQTPIYDEEVPYGGELEFYNNTLFVSNITNSPAPISTEDVVNEIKRGLGELRWSSLTNYSPEMFPVENFFIPDTPTNEIIAMATVSGKLIGFSRDRMYFIQKEGGGGSAFMRIVEMHEGFGTISGRTVAAIGSFIYFLTTRGVKTVSTQGRLDDVRAFDKVITDDWASVLSNCSLSYDPGSSAMFLLSPDNEEIQVLWFNSSRTTTIKDATFKETRTGVWPEAASKDKGDLSEADLKTALVERAMFLQNPPLSSTNAATGVPRVFILDYKREKRTADGGSNPRLTMQDGHGDTLLTTIDSLVVEEPWTSGVQVASTNIDITFTTDAGDVVGNPWIGSYIYCLESSDSSFIGKKSKVIGVENDAGGDKFYFGDSIFSNIPDGSILALSPVYFRWIGHPLPVTSESTGRVSQDLHRTKQIDSLGCSFVEVSSPDSSYDPYSRFKGTVVEGSIGSTKSENWVVDQEGTKVQSVKDGESDRWVSFGTDSDLAGNYGVIGGTLSPGVEVVVPDVDFRLMSVLVNGKILPSYRSDFPSTT